MPLLPVLLVVGVLPLVARVALVPFFDRELSPFPGFMIDADFFAWSKLIFLSVCGGLASIFHLLNSGAFRKCHPFRDDGLVLVPLGVMVVSALVSTWSSKYRATAVFGFPGHYEGLVAYVSYFVLFLLAYRIQWDRPRLAILTIAFLTMSLVIGVLSGLQYFDLYQMDEGVFRKLIFGTLAHDPTLSLMWTDPLEMTATLYNPNMVGSFAAIVVPLTSILFLRGRTKASWLLITLAALFFFVALGSHSRAGLIGILVALLSFCILDRKGAVACWPRYVSLGGVYAALFVLVGMREGGVYDRLKGEAKRDMQTLFAGTVISQNLKRGSSHAISIKKGESFYRSNERYLILKPLDQGFTASDKDGNLIPLIKSPTGISSLHPHYWDLSIELKLGPYGEKLVHLKWPPHEDTLALMGDGFKILAWGIPHESEYPKAINLFKDLSLFSNRAYIWSRSLPMLADVFAVGQGFGAFALYFPQRDFDGKIKVFGDNEIVIEKPHNMYLQFALGGGVSFLVSFVMVVSVIFYRGVKLVVRRPRETTILAANLCSCVGYLVTGCFNDSTIFVAPLFWIWFGVGASISLGRGGIDGGEGQEFEKFS